MYLLLRYRVHRLHLLSVLCTVHFFFIFQDIIDMKTNNKCKTAIFKKQNKIHAHFILLFLSWILNPPLFFFSYVRCADSCLLLCCDAICSGALPWKGHHRKNEWQSQGNRFLNKNLKDLNKLKIWSNKRQFCWEISRTKEKKIRQGRAISNVITSCLMLKKAQASTTCVHKNSRLLNNTNKHKEREWKQGSTP